jgi:hypothetical protein
MDSFFWNAAWFREDGAQRALELRTFHEKFFSMGQGQRPYFGGSLRSQFNQNLPPILRICLTTDKPRGFQPVQKLNRTVMPKQQAAREFADSRPGAGGQTFNRQQGLVLLRLQPVLTRAIFAELEKTAQGIPEFGQFPVLTDGNGH